MKPVEIALKNEFSLAMYNDARFVTIFENLIEKECGTFYCTRVAAAVRMLEGNKVRIYGFSEAENPQAEYFNEGEESDEGHHFAVINDR